MCKGCKIELRAMEFFTTTCRKGNLAFCALIIAFLGTEADSKAEDATSSSAFRLVQPGWDLTLEKSDGALQVVSASSPDTLSDDEARIIGQLRFLRSVAFAGKAEDPASVRVLEGLPSLKEVRLRLRWSPGPGQVKKVSNYLAALPTFSHLEI